MLRLLMMFKGPEELLKNYILQAIWNFLPAISISC